MSENSKSSLKKSSSKKSSTTGKIYIFTNSEKKEEYNQIKQIIMDITKDETTIGELKIDSKPYLYNIMIKKTKKTVCPQIFFNSEYFGVKFFI
jgi:hypothetical protein